MCIILFVCVNSWAFILLLIHLIMDMAECHLTLSICHSRHQYPPCLYFVSHFTRHPHHILLVCLRTTFAAIRTRSSVPNPFIFSLFPLFSVVSRLEGRLEPNTGNTLQPVLMVLTPSAITLLKVNWKFPRKGSFFQKMQKNLNFLWSPYVIGQTIIFLPCDFYLSSFFFFLALSQWA